MATKTNFLFLSCTIFLAIIYEVEPFLDFEELKSIHYGIDILNNPVLLGEESPVGSIQLTSKCGQNYQCSIPDQVEQERRQEERERVALETGVLELLKPMETSACLIKTRDWWSYEFCYKKHIRQFHLEDGKIKGEVIFIGQYESDFDWNNETLKEQKLKNSHALNRYHSQKYVNGSKCDLTNGFRSAEVRFVCEDTVNDYISRIDEPQTCAYILTVHTNKICNHPHLKPASPKTPVPITCNPLVDQQQYNDYLLHLAAEEEMKKEAELKERIVQLENEKRDRLTQLETEKQARLQDAEMGDEQTVLTGRTETYRVVGDSSKTLDTPQLEKAIHKAFDKEINKIEQQTGTESTDMKMSIKVIENMEDLESVLREQLTEAQKQKTAKLRKSSEIDKDKKKEESETINRQKENLNPEESDEEKKEKTDEDEEIIGYFQQEIDEVKKVFQAQDPEIKDQISESVRSQFETIINEAEQEAGHEVDKKQAFEQLSKALTNLLNKMDKTEKDLNAVNKEIQDSLDRKKEIESLNKETDEILDDTTDKNNIDSQKDDSLNRDDSFQKEEKVTETKDSDDLKRKQAKILESRVKESLEKAGLKTKGGQVQVKIITAGYYNSDDDSIHILSDDESQSFQSVIISLMTGGDDAVKEEAKHKSMEDNYNQVWSPKNTKSKVPKV